MNDLDNKWIVTWFDLTDLSVVWAWNLNGNGGDYWGILLVNNDYLLTFGQIKEIEYIGAFLTLVNYGIIAKLDLETGSIL